MLIRFLLPWKFKNPGETMEADGGVADVLVRRGFAEYVELAETTSVKQAKETATRKLHRT
jgi:hypothetical protein